MRGRDKNRCWVVILGKVGKLGKWGEGWGERSVGDGKGGVDGTNSRGHCQRLKYWSFPRKTDKGQKKNNTEGVTMKYG